MQSKPTESSRTIVSLGERSLEAIGRGLGWLVLIMTFTMTIVVILRYWFDIGSIALQEIAAYIHGTLFTIGAGYTLIHDGHVRVDILYRKWSAHRQALVDILGTVFLLMPFCGFVIFSSYEYVSHSWQLLESSAEAGGLPGLFLFKSMIPLMGLLLILAGITRLIRSFRVWGGLR